MSIEKFNPSIRGETVPYLQVNRNVVQSIRDPEVLAVWVYLLSLPNDWEVIKNHVQNHFKIGEKKLRSIFSSLRKHQLIDYIQNRNDDGKLGKHEIIVLNGSKFSELFTENTGEAIPARAENGWGGKDDLHIKQNTNKIENKKSFCENEQKKDIKAVNNSKGDWKEANQKKHSWAEPKKAPIADVTKQSTSWNAEEHNKPINSSPEAMKAAMMSLPRHIRPKQYRDDANTTNDNKKTTELPAGTAVQSEIPARSEPDEQGATIDVGGCQDNPSKLRGANRLLEARRVCSFLEEAGVAG